MAARLKNLDRDTPMLMPPDLRDWVRRDHIVNFIIDAVDRKRLTEDPLVCFFRQGNIVTHLTGGDDVFSGSLSPSWHCADFSMPWASILWPSGWSWLAGQRKLRADILPG